MMVRTGEKAWLDGWLLSWGNGCVTQRWSGTNKLIDAKQTHKIPIYSLESQVRNLHINHLDKEKNKWYCSFLQSADFLMVEDHSEVYILDHTVSWWIQEQNNRYWISLRVISIQLG